MRVVLVVLSLLTLCDGRGGVSGGGRGAGAARGASAAGARGASSGARGASSTAGRSSSSSSGSRGASSYAAAAAPRVVSSPVRRPSGSSIGAPLLGFGAGALAGAFTANRINNAYAPVSYGGNNYYWGRDVVPQGASLVCTRPLEDVSDVNFEEIMFQDGTRPVEFAWACAASEQCCDWKCCPDIGYARRSAAPDPSDPSTDPTDPADATLTLPLDEPAATNASDFALEDDVSSFDSDEESFRGSIAGWIILGVAVAALILFAICIACFAMKRRKRARQSRQSRQLPPSNSTREDAWSPDLPPAHRTPPVFTSSLPAGVPPSYSNVVLPMPKSTIPDKPPAYAS